jgi:alanyl-tRNA synthetase
MQQFKKYYTNPESAEKDFGSKNVASVQKCVRTSDIDEVGDNSHLTFFEMLGNFSFGGYFKKEAIEYAYEFLISNFQFPISNISVTVFGGDESIPRDNESIEIWKKIGFSQELGNLKLFGRSDNFWGPTGDEGPCGPTTEIFCKNTSGEDVEIWNIVFNEYFCDGSREKLDKGEAKLEKLPVLGIDTGMGLERLVTIVQKKESVYNTDLFNNEKTKEERIIADHIKSAIFLIADGIRPSNVERGYVLRRLIRRAMVYARKIGLSDKTLIDLVDMISEIYEGVYLLDGKNVDIKNTLITEVDKFKNTLEKGLKQFNKIVYESLSEPSSVPLQRDYGRAQKAHANKKISGEDAFLLFSTYGFPLEMTLELALEKGIEVDVKSFEKYFKKHQEESRKGAEHKFKGGLADHELKTIRLHTAHHLLLAALKLVLGPNVKQRGSNITAERLRIDFAFDRKLTDEEKKKVEDIVNQKIKESLPVVRKELPRAEAEKLGAEMEFGAKYGETVSVYFIEDRGGNVFSVEFCGGPHVANTSELALSSNPSTPLGAKFKILKEEAVASGIRRIKAILEQ